MKKITKHTIKDFTPVIPFEQIEEVLGKKECNKFIHWMRGQTMTEGGVYPWDLERYLNNKPIID